MPLAELTYSTYPHGLPLFGGGRRLVNMFAERAEGQTRMPYALLGSPGMKSYSDLTTVANTAGNECRGFVEFNDTKYSVVGSYLCSVASGGTPSLVASNIAGSGPVSFSYDNNELVICTDQDDFLFDGTSLSQYTGANIVDFRSVGYIDGRLIGVQASPDIPGRFSYSDVNALATIGASSFANAESEPDALLQVRIVDRRILFLGANTIEPWYTTGDGTTPFTRYADGIEPYGLAADNAATVLNGRLFFLAKSNKARPHIRMMAAGSRSERISNNAIDAVIDSGTYSDARAFAYEQRGHGHVKFVFPTLGRCFAFDLSTGFWHENQSGVNIVAGWDARQCMVADDKVIVGHKSDGKLYELDFDTHTDAGEKRMAMFTARLPSSGERWNRFDRLLVKMKTGVSAAGDEEAGNPEPQMIVDFSTNGGQTWGDEEWIGIGYSGDHDRIAEARGLGAFIDGDVRFRITDPVERGIVAVHASGAPERFV